MDKMSQLRFAAMAPDAQRAAIRRLALKGLEDTEIAQATGWSTSQVRDVLAPAHEISMLPLAHWWQRRSGSAGGSASP